MAGSIRPVASQCFTFALVVAVQRRSCKGRGSAKPSAPEGSYLATSSVTMFASSESSTSPTKVSDSTLA